MDGVPGARVVPFIALLDNYMEKGENLDGLEEKRNDFLVHIF